MIKVTRIWHELTGEVFELFGSSSKNRQMINCLKEKEPKAAYGDPLSPMVPKDVLLGFLNQEQARRRTIEEKAKTNVLAITIAFSAMIAGVAIASEIAGIANRSAGWMVWPIIASQSVGIVFRRP